MRYLPYCFRFVITLLKNKKLSARAALILFLVIPVAEATSTVTSNGTTKEISEETEIELGSVNENGTLSYDCQNVDTLSATVYYEQEDVVGGRVTVSEQGKFTIDATPQNPTEKPSGKKERGDLTISDVQNLTWTDVSN